MSPEAGAIATASVLVLSSIVWGIADGQWQVARRRALAQARIARIQRQATSLIRAGRRVQSLNNQAAATAAQLAKLNNLFIPLGHITTPDPRKKGQ